MSPSTFIPIHFVPKVVTFVRRMERVEIHALVSAGLTGSKRTKAPAVGRLVPYAFSDPNVPWINL